MRPRKTASLLGILQLCLCQRTKGKLCNELRLSFKLCFHTKFLMRVYCLSFRELSSVPTSYKHVQRWSYIYLSLMIKKNIKKYQDLWLILVHDNRLCWICYQFLLLCEVTPCIWDVKDILPLLKCSISYSVGKVRLCMS